MLDVKSAMKWVLSFLALQVILALIGVAPFPYSFLLESRAYISWAYVFFYVFLLYVFSGVFEPRHIFQVVLGGLILGGVLLFGLRDESLAVDTRILVLMGGIGFVALSALLARRRSLAARKKIDALLGFLVLLLLIAPLPNTALSLTAVLHPAIYDPVAFHFDQILGFQPSVILALVADTIPGMKRFFSVVYSILPWGFAILFALTLRYPAGRRFDLLRFWIFSGFFAYFAYHVVPVAGPKYLFGDAFPASVVADQVPWTTLVRPAAPRNGVPSMHFGWALSMWLMAMHFPTRWARHGFAVFLGTTILATMALGEHYLVDLVVSIPVIVGLYAYFLRDLSWETRRPVVWSGLVVTLGWLLFLRWGSGLVQKLPGLVPVAELATVALFVWLHRRMMSLPPLAEEPELSAPTIAKRGGYAREVWWVGGVFVLSGFAGLVYEVVFSKALALSFGSTALATYTVLATYMGGMALGSWIGGHVAERVEKPLVAYAICELAVGVYCILTPTLFALMRELYVQLAAGYPPEAAMLTALRFGLGALVLLVPTVLMGITLPLLVRFLGDRHQRLGVSVAVLYGANTMGAAAGALLSGYLILPLLGVSQTTLLAAVLNFMAAFLGLRLVKQLASQSADASRAIDPMPDEPAGNWRQGVAALLVLAVGGCLTLMLEVNYVHLLAIVAGNSVYAFALMLATFLAGLSLGSLVARRLMRTGWEFGVIMAWLQAGLAFSVLAAVFAWDDIPAYFAGYANYPYANDFASREFIRGMVCAAVMLPPTVLIGAIYPIALDAVGRAFPARKLVMTGRAMALNTLGNISGVLLAGFVLLPAIGALSLNHVIAATAATLVLLLALTLRQRPWRAWLPLPIVALIAAFQPVTFNYSALASGTNVYFAPQGFGDVIDHAESVDGGLTTVALVPAKDGHPAVKTLLTNGKFQGNNSLKGEMQAQVGFALAPLLHTAARERALVIGYGTGATSRTIHDAGFSQVDIVELSQDIFTLANRHFQEINAGVSGASGVNAYITDGRNFLLLQPRRYDFISMEITSIWFAGAAALYNREFYQLAKRRLTDTGVMQQWVQLHHMRVEDFITVMATVRSEFEFVWLYEIGGQGIIVATNHRDAFATTANIQKIKNTPTLQTLLAIYGDDPDNLRKKVLLTPAQTNQLIKDTDLPDRLLISIDDNVRLEYGTPKGNVLDEATSIPRILGLVKRYSAEKKGVQETQR